MSYRWIEEDFDLPFGVTRLVALQPEHGKTYLMYHGTSRACAESIRRNGFEQSKTGMLGPGIYLSRDLEKASRYPLRHPEHDKVVIRVVVNVGKVIVINSQDHPRRTNWHDSRYGQVFDTAWVPANCGMVKSGLEENCVWDPRRITFVDTIEPQLVYFHDSQ